MVEVLAVLAIVLEVVLLLLLVPQMFLQVE
jgi:hypothetical protein